MLKCKVKAVSRCTDHEVEDIICGNTIDQVIRNFHKNRSEQYFEIDTIFVLEDGGKVINKEWGEYNGES